MTSINVNMIDTIERGDHLRLEKLIKLGADIFSIQSFHHNAQPPYCWYPPVYVAISFNQKKCGQILINNGTLTRACNWDGLDEAKKRGSEYFIELIDIRRKIENKLIKAICVQDRESAIWMLNRDSSLVHANENWHGGDRTPLMYACQHGNVELVKCLISKGANVFAQAHATSVNAMTLAHFHQNHDIVEVLLEYGAESKDITNFLYAAGQGKMEYLVQAIDKGININEKDECKRHVLAQAFMTGDYDLINYLYENGVDPNQSHGWEEYMWLEHHIKKGEFDAVHWMFQHGYDPNIKKLMTKPP